MKILEIEENDRPREKIINKGPSSLSNIELLAIMLASGSKNESVLDLSARLINEYGFERLFQMSYYELKNIKGIKEAKATRLMALFEIARRVKSLSLDYKKPLATSKDVFLYLKNEYSFLKTEVVKIIYVDKLCKAIKLSTYSGDVAMCSLPFRDIVSEAINLKAYGIFLSHNHPSGDLRPSRADIEATKGLIELLKPLGIHVFDHLIIHEDEFYSFSDERTLLTLI